MGGEFLEGERDVFRLRVAGEIDVEDVFPILALGGAGFDLGEVDVEVVEGLEGVDERAGPVVDREEDGGAVVAGGRAGFLADDEEAGGVGGAVLDGGFEEVEAMDLGGEGTPERGGAFVGFFPCELGGLGGGGDLHEIGLGEIFQDPAPALAEDLGVGVKGADLVPRDGGHQAVFDAEQDLRADVER